MINMIGTNIKYLRAKAAHSQEELAEKLGVSRQTIAKWENGDTLPDVNKCAELAVLYGVSLDAFITVPFDEEAEETENHIEDNYVFGIVKVGERGQVVIPKQARNVYNIKPGDKLLVVGDARGMAFAKIKGFEGFRFGD